MLGKQQITSPSTYLDDGIQVIKNVFITKNMILIKIIGKTSLILIMNNLLVDKSYNTI